MTATDQHTDPVLYVSPCARCFLAEPREAATLGRDLSQVDDDDVGRVYRRLDVSWYAWLIHRMAMARRLAKAGELSSDQATAVSETFARLRIVRAWALLHLDQEELNAAVGRGIPQGYQGPHLNLTLKSEWNA